MIEKPILKLFDKLEDNFINRILNQTTDCCSLLNREKIFLFWNKAAEDLTEIKKEEILGNPANLNHRSIWIRWAEVYVRKIAYANRL